MLTQRQSDAIAAYERLMREFPALARPRRMRPLVLDRGRMEAYAAKENCVLGVAAETKYVWLLVDLVQSQNAQGEWHEYTYFRLVYRKQLEGAANTVIVGQVTNPAIGPSGGIVLVRQERHATGRTHWELPRGFGETGLTAEANALKELREETGYIGEAARVVGVTCTDTGAMDAEVAFVHVSVVDYREAAAEPEEVIESVRVCGWEEVLAMIRAGEIDDGFTVQAVALLSVAAS
jgi:ADP-ribose pyrophosphatase